MTKKSSTRPSAASFSTKTATISRPARAKSARRTAAAEIKHTIPAKNPNPAVSSENTAATAGISANFLVNVKTGKQANPAMLEQLIGAMKNAARK